MKLDEKAAYDASSSSFLVVVVFFPNYYVYPSPPLSNIQGRRDVKKSPNSLSSCLAPFFFAQLDIRTVTSSSLLVVFPEVCTILNPPSFDVAAESLHAHWTRLGLPIPPRLFDNITTELCRCKCIPTGIVCPAAVALTFCTMQRATAAVYYFLFNNVSFYLFCFRFLNVVWILCFRLRYIVALRPDLFFFRLSDLFTFHTPRNVCVLH